MQNHSVCACICCRELRNVSFSGPITKSQTGCIGSMTCDNTIVFALRHYTSAGNKTPAVAFTWRYGFSRCWGHFQNIHNSNRLNNLVLHRWCIMNDKSLPFISNGMRIDRCTPLEMRTAFERSTKTVAEMRTSREKRYRQHTESLQP